MKFNVSDDKQFLILVDSTLLEFEQLESSLTRKMDNWFIMKKKFPHWDGEIKFIDSYNRVPIGLWKEVRKICQQYSFPLEIVGVEHLFDKDFDETDLMEWVHLYFEEAEDLIPRDYQSEAVARLLKFRRCTEEISTSGGKTLIAFMFFKYLFDKKAINKLLYVVPNLGLVTQTEEKFYLYETKTNHKPNWKSDCAFGGAKSTVSNPNIIFGTYQTLTKKSEEYFAQFDAVCIDECLHPDTLITMENFSKKKIKDIQIGEKIWTYNERTQKQEIKEVEFVYKNLSQNEQMYEIETENGIIIKITGNHKILTNNGWKRVDEINEKEEIISFNMMNI